MRTNLEHSQIWRPKITGISFSNAVITLTATFNVPVEGPGVYFLNGGAASRTVKLPALLYGNQVVLINTGTLNGLDITDTNGVALVTLPPQSSGIFYSGSSQWGWVAGYLAAFGGDVSVVMGSGAIASTVTSVQTNQSGAIVLTLPSSITWAALHGYTTPLSIFDISGTASTNNVTINPSGGQTISGLASLTIANDYGGWKLMPKSGGGWVFV